MTRYLVGRSNEILHLEAGEGVDFERYGETLRLLADTSKIAYGSLYLYSLGSSSVVVAVAAPDTFYRVNSGLSFGVIKRVLFQNARELVAQVAGTYHVDWHMSIECASANQEIEGSLMVNGTAFTPIASHGESVTANRPVALGSTGLIALKAGDVVALAVLNHTAANNLTVDHLNLAIERMGD